MEEFNIDAFQIRMNWRWNERKEDEYDFSNVDKLLELEEKNGRKVMMKFLLECAPQYIYEKYDGTRIGPKGEKLRPGAASIENDGKLTYIGRFLEDPDGRMLTYSIHFDGEYLYTSYKMPVPSADKPPVFRIYKVRTV